MSRLTGLLFISMALFAFANSAKDSSPNQDGASIMAGNGDSCSKMADCDIVKGLFCLDKDGDAVGNDGGHKCGCMKKTHYCEKVEECRLKSGDDCVFSQGDGESKMAYECSPGQKCEGGKCKGEIESDAKCGASSLVYSITLMAFISLFFIKF